MFQEIRSVDDLRRSLQEIRYARHVPVAQRRAALKMIPASAHKLSALEKSSVLNEFEWGETLGFPPEDSAADPADEARSFADFLKFGIRPRQLLCDPSSERTHWFNGWVRAVVERWPYHEQLGLQPMLFGLVHLIHSSVQNGKICVVATPVWKRLIHSYIQLTFYAPRFADFG